MLAQEEPLCSVAKLSCVLISEINVPLPGYEKLTPLVILSTTAEETGKSIEQVEDEVNDSMATPDEEADPNIQEETINDDEELELIRTHGPSSKYFTKN